MGKAHSLRFLLSVLCPCLSDDLCRSVLLCRPAGEHRQPREDGAHHEGVPHPQQSVGACVQPLQREVWGIHTGNSSVGTVCPPFPALQGRVLI